MQDTEITEIATTLAEGLDVGDPNTVELNDGRTVTARMHHDDDVTPFEYDNGTYCVVPTDRNTGNAYRPDGYDGKARKIHTRDDVYWWQPPAYLATDAEIDSMYRYLRGFFNGDWYYVGLTVEIGDAQAGVWGCDYGAGTYAETLAWAAETLAELLSEALNDPTANVCPCCKRNYDAA